MKPSSLQSHGNAPNNDLKTRPVLRDHDAAKNVKWNATPKAVKIARLHSWLLRVIDEDSAKAAKS